MVRFLSYSAPAVLTAIWVPIILIQENELALSLSNPYLVAAIIAVFTAAKSKSVYLTVGLGILSFYLLLILV
jgi:branched-subunit amino acid transport protein